MSLEALTAQADAIHTRYRNNFAGRSRVGRDLKLLDTLIADADKLLAALPADADALRATVTEWRTLYAAERENIAKIQGAGPDVVAAWTAAEWALLSFYRYNRDFAGQNRLTRDLGLLQQTIAEQEGWIAAAKGKAGLDDQVARMTEHLGMYKKEFGEIPAARAKLSPADRAKLQASLANHQFALYRLHFADKPRHSRRPALLGRILGQLQALHADMIATRDQGVRTESHTQNIAKVAERVRHHNDERANIERARMARTTREVAGALGDDANQLLAAFRKDFAGQPRQTRDIQKLAELCERLQEVARAMADLQRERPEEGNRKNLLVVLDQLRAWEREFEAVRNIKRAEAAAAAAPPATT